MGEAYQIKDQFCSLVCGATNQGGVNLSITWFMKKEHISFYMEIKKKRSRAINKLFLINT